MLTVSEMLVEIGLNASDVKMDIYECMSARSRARVSVCVCVCSFLFIYTISASTTIKNEKSTAEKKYIMDNNNQK